MAINLTKTPRVYVIADSLHEGQKVSLDDKQSHYLLIVMRMKDDDDLRVFNGKNGEFHAKIEKTGKKSANLVIKSQIQPFFEPNPLTLYFVPIKKDRMAFMIEKAVELGVTDFYPVQTQRSDVRAFNPEKIEKQIVEAAEQCERLDIPVLHGLRSFDAFVQNTDEPVQVAIERGDYDPINKSEGHACLIGPEGGWSDQEKQALLSAHFVKPVSLGPRILRAETAAIYMLSHLSR